MRFFYFEQECSFIRCIKPNTNQSSDIFDKNFVLSQLVLSCSIAYQQLMRIGFPAHLDIPDLFKMLNSKQYFNEQIGSQKVICAEIMRSCGLEWKDFKLGNTKIFFRRGKLDLISEKLNGDLTLIINQHKKLKILRKKWRIALIVSRFCTISKIQLIQNDSANTTANVSTNDTVMTNSGDKSSYLKGGKKRKLYQMPDQMPHQSSSQSESAEFSGINSRL